MAKVNITRDIGVLNIAYAARIYQDAQKSITHAKRHVTQNFVD